MVSDSRRLHVCISRRGRPLGRVAVTLLSALLVAQCGSPSTVPSPPPAPAPLPSPPPQPAPTPAPAPTPTPTPAPAPTPAPTPAPSPAPAPTPAPPPSGSQTFNYTGAQQT